MVLTLIVLSTLFGKTIFLEFFYIFPITIVSWYGSRKSGILLALLSTFLLLSINAINRGFDVIALFNYGLPCAIGLSMLAILITNFRNVHRIESIAAYTDSLTNINNSRGFYIELANELVRSARYEHIFSLAYMDIDNFKLVNDSRGHTVGDDLLIEVAKNLKEALRSTDIVARLGGDEFACLLPETGQEKAKAAFLKASELLEKRMLSHRWPVSFSIGMVTFETMPEDFKEAMKVADELMYSVKNSAKNNISYKIY
jgi:diguanylate cyclase (GGDEF)-like protein